MMQRFLRTAINRTTSTVPSGNKPRLLKSNFLTKSSSTSSLANAFRSRGVPTAITGALVEVMSLRCLDVISGAEKGLIRGWDAGVEEDDDGG